MILEDAIRTYVQEITASPDWSPRSVERYSRQLAKFQRHVGATTPVEEITPASCRSYLATFTEHAASTVALDHTILRSFFRTLVLDDVIDANPMDKVRRPKVLPLRDRPRVRITTEQVQMMLTAAETWPEKLCLNVLAYTGVRRSAASALRWAHVDGKRHTLTFTEKGNKRITKPIADELRRVFTAYIIAEGPQRPEQWVIPNKIRIPTDRERQSKIIWDLVKGVANRCGVRAHCHSMRAAFAVHFLRTNPAQLEALRQLMGHTAISTTQGYLDELEGEDAMRVVERLSFGAAA
jgi:site-specific recombinase XerD